VDKFLILNKAFCVSFKEEEKSIPLKIQTYINVRIWCSFMWAIVGTLNTILHTAWLNNLALTLKNNTAKYCFGEKSSFLHTFLKFSCDSRKIEVKFKNISTSML
jgi:hypothetical protein